MPRKPLPSLPDTYVRILDPVVLDEILDEIHIAIVYSEYAFTYVTAFDARALRKEVKRVKQGFHIETQRMIMERAFGKGAEYTYPIFELKPFDV